MNRLIEGFRPDDGREVVRVVAGILIAVGCLLLAYRRGTSDYFEDQTSNFGLFVIFAAPAGFLYGAGILGRTLGGFDRRWQALYTVTGMILMPIALFYLAATIDSGYDETLVAIFVFSASAAACVVAWLIASVRFQLLLGALYAAFAWLAFLDQALSDGLDSDLSTVRALLLVFAGALIVAAFVVRGRARVEPEAAFGELLTGAGLAALIAYSLGPLVALTALSISTSFGPTPDEVGFVSQRQDMIWDVLTLLTGAGLIVFGLGRGLRGPVYVGVLMVLLFTMSVGLDLDDATPEGKVVGWPLLLCVLGAGTFLVSMLPAERFPSALGLGRWFEGARDPEPAAVEVDPTERQPPPPLPPPTGSVGEPPPPPGVDPAQGRAPTEPAPEEREEPPGR